MRLFLSIQLNDAFRAALTDTQRQMRRSGMEGNFAPVENLHLTLAFIGEYGEPETVADVLRGVSFHPFPLRQ